MIRGWWVLKLTHHKGVTMSRIQNLVKRCDELKEFSRMNDPRYFQLKSNDDAIQLGKNAFPETRVFYANI